jgi:hypothetical protein
VIEWLSDWVGGIALALTTAVGGWLVGLHSRVNAHATRLAVLDVRMDDIPNGLLAIKTEIQGLRDDGNRRERMMFDQLEKLRLELKDDLARKADRDDR